MSRPGGAGKRSRISGSYTPNIPNLQVDYTPKKTNMEPENDCLDRNLLFQGFIFRFHVSFLGCNLFAISKLPGTSKQGLIFDLNMALILVFHRVLVNIIPLGSTLLGPSIPVGKWSFSSGFPWQKCNVILVVKICILDWGGYIRSISKSLNLLTNHGNLRLPLHNATLARKLCPLIRPY